MLLIVPSVFHFDSFYVDFARLNRPLFVRGLFRHQQGVPRGSCGCRPRWSNPTMRPPYRECTVSLSASCIKGVTNHNVVNRPTHHHHYE